MIEWTSEILADIGRDSDLAVACKHGLSESAVRKKRHALGLDAANRVVWTAELEAELGTMTDAAFAQKHNLPVGTEAIASRRRKLGIMTRPNNAGVVWTDAWLSRLGQERDEVLAAEIGIHPATVGAKRRALGIKAKR